MHRLLAIALLTLSVASARPNLLFITVDDMNRDSVGVYGCRIENITPNIDRLAGQGLTFERGHVTIAICMPTRAVWMTGRYPHRSGALGFDRINPDVPSLPEALQKGGYHTALLAKEIHVVPSRHAAFDQITRQDDLGGGRSIEGYREATQRAIKGAKEAGKPFFIMANTADPHRPFAGERGDPYKQIPYSRKFTPEEVPVPGFLPDLPLIRQELVTYFQSVHRADDVVGGILDELEKSGEADNTVVLFMSDHGMPLPFAKTNCYYASTVTPWIIRWPGKVQAGKRDAVNFVSGIDVAPTLLDAAGLPPLVGCDGRSILPLLSGKSDSTRNHVFTMMNSTFTKTPYPMRALNDGGYLYIWNGWADGKTAFRNESQSGLSFKAMLNSEDLAARQRAEFYSHRCPEELYDLLKDSDCLNNLIAAPNDKWSPRAGAMAVAMWHWMKKTDDPQWQSFTEQVRPALD